MWPWWTKLRWPVLSIDGSLRHAEEQRNRAELGPSSGNFKLCPEIPWFCELGDCKDDSSRCY